MDGAEVMGQEEARGKSKGRMCVCSVYVCDVYMCVVCSVCNVCSVYVCSV